MSADRKRGLARERLRRRYRPARVRVLFVGEAPPASGRFFYHADSGLYRAIRDAFVSVFPDIGDEEFLQWFQTLGCYLVDLCGRPVDRLPRNRRTRARRDGEGRLARILKRLRPEIVITVVRSIAGNVRRSQQRANWLGARVELPYPGRWNVTAWHLVESLHRHFARSIVGDERNQRPCKGKSREQSRNISTITAIYARNRDAEGSPCGRCLEFSGTGRVSLAYSLDSRWRNRSEFVNGRQEIVAFLKRKWSKELDYRLIKELWAFEGNRIAVRFDDSGNWFRSYGNENWESMRTA